MELVKQDYIIVPKISVGPFRLDTPISNYDQYELDFYKSEEANSWDTYELKNDISIYTEDDQIVSIACHVPCVINGVQIIGSQFSDFKSAFHPESILHDQITMPGDKTYHDVYDVDELGLQLWCKDDVIVTVFCGLE